MSESGPGPWRLLHDDDEGWFVAWLPAFEPEAVYVMPLDPEARTLGPFSEAEAIAVRDALNGVTKGTI